MNNLATWFLLIWYAICAVVAILFLMNQTGVKLFVSKSKYQSLLFHYNELAARYNRLSQLYDLKSESSKKNSVPMFDDDEMRKLIFLCHPDKHNNSVASQELTKKLLQLRKK